MEIQWKFNNFEPNFKIVYNLRACAPNSAINFEHFDCAIRH